jgi:hypothetical protein
VAEHPLPEEAAQPDLRLPEIGARVPAGTHQVLVVEPATLLEDQPAVAGLGQPHALATGERRGRDGALLDGEDRQILKQVRGFAMADATPCSVSPGAMRISNQTFD